MYGNPYGYDAATGYSGAYVADYGALSRTQCQQMAKGMQWQIVKKFCTGVITEQEAAALHPGDTTNSFNRSGRNVDRSTGLPAASNLQKYLDSLKKATTPPEPEFDAGIKPQADSAWYKNPVVLLGGLAVLAAAGAAVAYSR